MKIYIYTLTDPRNNQIRYVGKTNNLEQRFKDHCNPNYRKTNIHRKNWINSMKKDGFKPLMEILEETNEFDWKQCESYWISQMKTWGMNLINYTLGGDGCTFGNDTSFKKGHNAKLIIALTKDGKFVKEFLGKKAAEDFCGKKCVDNALSRKLKYAGDYLWLYKEVYEEMTKEKLEEFVSWANELRKKSSNTSTQFCQNHEPWNKGKKGHKLSGLKTAKIIYQYDLNNNFIKEWTISEAAEYYKVTASNIINCLTNKSKTACGFKWKYNYEK